MYFNQYFSQKLTSMDKIKLVEKLNKLVSKGEIKKINERHSFDIGVTDGNKTFSCVVIVDLYTDLEDNHLYRVEHNVDQQKNYHTIDITEFANGFFSL